MAVNGGVDPHAKRRMGQTQGGERTGLLGTHVQINSYHVGPCCFVLPELN